MNSLRQIEASDDGARLAGLAFELSLDMLCVLTPEGLFERVNPAWAQTLGWTEAQLLGRHWLDLAHAEQRALLEQAGAAAPPQEKGFELQGQFACADGSHRDLAWRWQRTEDGRSICVVRDITAQKRAEQSLRESEDRWKLALESAGDGVWDWYPQTGVEIFSRRFVEMYGYSEEELTSRPEEFDKRTHPDDIEQLLRDRQAHIEGRTPTYINEHRVQCKDGTWKWILTRGMVISRDEQGRPLRMIGTHTDITSRKQDEALIWQQAHFDGLTGLPNRRMLRERLAQAMARCVARGRQLALLFIDLDHFKEVNDTLGHDKGDLLLVQAAQRISDCLREGDTVARMGGDEFTVVMPGLSDPAEVEDVAQAILDALSAGFQLGNELSFVSASIGITLYPQDAELIEDLFKHADQALYVAKDAGRKRFSYFTPELQAAAQNRLRLANDLRAALGAGQFEVHYQPIIELGSGAVHKAEALLRWQHPTRGPVAPNLFIPIAEASGLIIAIGDWVFRQAAAQVGRWRAALHPDFQISINKSPVQFRVDAQQGPVWAALLQSLGLPVHSLVVEITEGLLLDGSADVAARLMDLHAAGIGVSLDDFGTGYSSLSYLQKFDIDYLKIDQSFVRGLNPLSKDMALCRAIIVMAHELGMKVIAEGVETPLQRDLLAEAGCDYAQGYLFAKAMPPDVFEAWLVAKAS